MTPFTRTWGTGPPVIALHPLGLESSGFSGVGRMLARRGMRTIAVDLPGFGRTPAPDEPLRPDVLAAPIIELARSLETPPVVLGISLGGRVALEAALRAPDAFRAVVPIAPYLPWTRFRFLLQGAHLLSPELGSWLPFERMWPALRWLAETLEQTPYLREDEMAQAGARLVYYLACPATRMSMISASRELALDPAFGPEGFWTRLEQISIPTTFVWGERDRLINMGFAHRVAQICPQAEQIVLPCAGHWLNGPHHRCLGNALAALVVDLKTTGRMRRRATSESRAASRRVGEAWLAMRPCQVAGAKKAVPSEPILKEARHG